MTTDAEHFCNSCGQCQTTKPSNQKPAGLLHLLLIPERPWELIRMDFIGPLCMSGGYDYLLVIIDCLTSQTHLVPTKTTVQLRR